VEAVYRDDSRRSINRTAYREARLLVDMAKENSRVRRIMSCFDRLLQKRVEEKAFHPNAGQEVLDLGSEVFAVKRASTDGTSTVFCLINVTAESVDVAVPGQKAGLGAGEVVDIITEQIYGPDADEWTVALEPYDVCWLKAV